MSKKERTIKVSPKAGELGRFDVESWSNPRLPHTVDLLAFGGQGSCSCTDWTTKCRPNQKEHPYQFIPYGPTKNPNPNRQACRHVTIARRYFMIEVLMGLSKEHRSGDGT